MNRPSFSSRIVRAAVLCAAAVPAAACGSLDDGQGRARTDEAGAVIAEVVRVASVDRSSVNQDGRVRYVVDNLSAADTEDLVWSVTFVFPRGAGGGEIEVDEVAETTAERPLKLARGEKGRLLEAVCGQFAERRAAGQAVVGTRLNVLVNPPVFTVARDASGNPGTRFANNRIECVGQSDIYADDGTLSIEFENVSDRRVSDLRVQVVFTESRDRTKWKAIPEMAPGQRAKVTLDIRGLRLGARDFLVKVEAQDV